MKSSRRSRKTPRQLRKHVAEEPLRIGPFVAYPVKVAPVEVQLAMMPLVLSKEHRARVEKARRRLARLIEAGIQRLDAARHASLRRPRA